MTTMKIPLDIAKNLTIPVSKYTAERLILPGDKKADKLVERLQREDQPDYRLFVHSAQNFSEFATLMLSSVCARGVLLSHRVGKGAAARSLIT